MTLCKAVRCGKSWKSWKIMPNTRRTWRTAGGGLVIAMGRSTWLPDADLAGVEGVQAVDAAQQRRLAAAAGADKRHGLARLDRQADVVQHQLRSPKRLVTLSEIATCTGRSISPFPQRFSR